jgi:predicted dehydrogenase
VNGNATGDSLRAATIGAGRISAEHLKFLTASEKSVLVGVCDLSPAMADFARRRYQAENAFTDHGRMLEEARPQVVHILTPPHTHETLVRDCLDAGAHVICEKPVALTRAGVGELWQYAQDRDRILVEDHNVRFSEPFLAIEELLADDVLGDVREVEIRMTLKIAQSGARYADRNLPHPSHQLPAGVIHEFLPHLTYSLLRFMPKVDSVRAAWSRHGDNDLFKYDDLDAMLLGGNIHGRIRFTSWNAPDCFNVVVRGTHGWVETDLYHPYQLLTKPRAGGDKLGAYVNQMAQGLSLMKASVVGVKDKILQKTLYEGLQTFLSQTYAALLTGSEPPVTFSDMDASAALIDALLADENRA